MKALKNVEKTANIVVCVNNEGYELDLEPLKLYEVISDSNLEPEDIRVIDDSGEDYIYPASYFASVGNIDRGRHEP